MFIDMNPLEVDVGRKKRKADARYSLTSACLGLFAYSLNGSCNSPITYRFLIGCLITVFSLDSSVLLKSERYISWNVTMLASMAIARITWK